MSDVWPPPWSFELLTRALLKAALVYSKQGSGSMVWVNLAPHHLFERSGCHKLKGHKCLLLSGWENCRGFPYVEFLEGCRNTGSMSNCSLLWAQPGTNTREESVERSRTDQNWLRNLGLSIMRSREDVLTSRAFLLGAGAASLLLILRSAQNSSGVLLLGLWVYVRWQTVSKQGTT